LQAADTRPEEDKVKISGVHHACVIVSDMEKSLKFYRDTLGLKEKVNIKCDVDPAMMDLPGTEPKLHLVLLSAGNAHVELIHYIEPKGRPNDRRTCDNGTLHLGFQVDDIRKMYTDLKSKGVRFHRDPLLIGEAGEGLAGHWYVYLRGPDNEVLEFIQPPK
jgi:catechol 2,3-dioxygenase-like lactoylglutathione lyase family enzyme